MSNQVSRKEADEQMMTCAEVASFLRVSIHSVHRWSRSGNLKAYKVGFRGDYRYWRQDVLAFLRDGAPKSE